MDDSHWGMGFSTHSRIKPLDHGHRSGHFPSPCIDPTQKTTHFPHDSGRQGRSRKNLPTGHASNTRVALQRGTAFSNISASSTPTTGIASVACGNLGCGATSGRQFSPRLHVVETFCFRTAATHLHETTSSVRSFQKREATEMERVAQHSQNP